jgi:hypothetical protein
LVTPERDQSGGRHRLAKARSFHRGLRAGTAYSTIAVRYRRGDILRSFGGELGVTPAVAGRILVRRPWWCREVFRGPKGERLDLAPFAAKLKNMREGRGWTRKQLAFKCELSPVAIG